MAKLIPSNKIIIFSLLVALAAALRLVNMGKNPPWADERLSQYEAKGWFAFNLPEDKTFTYYDLQKLGNFQNIIDCSLKIYGGDGGNGILYIFCLHYWIKLFGNSYFSNRLISFFIGIFVVMMGFFFCKEVFNDNRKAFFSMFLLAIHPQLIFYSQHSRPYMMAVFFTLSASFLFYKLANNKEFNHFFLFLYALLVIVSTFSHFFTISIFITHVFILLFLLKTSTHNWIKLSVYLFFAGFIIALWMYNYGFEGLKTISKRSHYFTAMQLTDPYNPFYGKATFSSVGSGWLLNLLAYSGNTIIYMGFRIREIAFLLIIPFILLYLGIKRTDALQRNKLKILIALSSCSILFATFMSIIFRHSATFQMLYSIFSAPYFVFLLALPITGNIPLKGFRAKVTNLLIISQIALMVFSLSTYYSGYNTAPEHTTRLYEQVLRKMNQSGNHISLVSYNSKDIAFETNRYLDKKLINIKQIINSSDTAAKITLYFTKNGNDKILWKKRFN